MIYHVNFQLTGEMGFNVRSENEQDAKKQALQILHDLSFEEIGKGLSCEINDVECKPLVINE